jgi:hypothetical protein
LTCRQKFSTITRFKRVSVVFGYGFHGQAAAGKAKNFELKFTNLSRVITKAGFLRKDTKFLQKTAGRHFIDNNVK